MHSVLLSALFLIFKKWALLSVLHFTFVSVCRQRLPVFAHRKIFGGPSNPAPLGLFITSNFEPDPSLHEYSSYCTLSHDCIV